MSLLTDEDTRALLEASQAARARYGEARGGCEPEAFSSLVFRVAATALPVRPASVRTIDPIEHRRRRVEQAVQQIPEGRRWATFDAPELAARVVRRKAILESRNAVGKHWVLWQGAAGSGKTSLACAAVRLWLASDGPTSLTFATAYSLARARMRHALGEGEAPIVERALEAEFIVLDDLGEGEPAHGSAVAEVIYEREAHDRITWITTWRSEAEIAKLYGDGIARRVFERAKTIQC